jgi:hypothetical protein
VEAVRSNRGSLRPNGVGAGRPVAGWWVENAVSISWPRGKYFLIGGQDGDAPHMFDVSTKKPVWSEETATGTTFWPRPGSTTK